MTFDDLLAEAQALATTNVRLVREAVHGPLDRLRRAAVSGSRVTRGELRAVERLAGQVEEAEARAARLAAVRRR